MGPNERAQFTAGCPQAPWNTAVNWTASVSVITTSGLYTAPASIATATTATITATSAADGSTAGSATVTLSPAQSGITVSVTPATASLVSGQTQQFAAAVAGTSNTAVTWTVVPPIGMIDSTALYTASRPRHTSAQTVTVQAASAASPANFGTATILLAPPSENAYSYRRPIVVSHTQVVNSPQPNFAVEITGAYPWLATASNGGHVQNGSGFDILFTSDCAGLQPLPFEIGAYNPATGAATFWVVLPSVSPTAEVSSSTSPTATVQSPPARRTAPPPTPPRVPQGRSSDWTATTANNTTSPSTFYTIYPGNSNSVAPSLISLAAGQTEQFSPLFLSSASASRSTQLTLLGTVQTPSPAESIAVNGNTAYVCDDNEISVLDITNPTSPRFPSAASLLGAQPAATPSTAPSSAEPSPSSPMAAAAPTSAAAPPVCSTSASPTPSSPNSTPASRSPAAIPAASSSPATPPTSPAPHHPLLLGTVADAFGQLFAIDTTNFAAPQTLSALLGNPPSIANGTGPNTGYVLGAALVNPQTVYAAGSADPQTEPWNTKTGRLQVVNVSNPSAISLVKEIDVPGTVDLFNVAIQGNLAVAVGDTGGVDAINDTGFQGNLAVVTFDITNPQSPNLLRTATTAYRPSLAGPSSAVQIGTNLFLFGGMLDTAGNNVLLQVDVTNPLNPVLTSYSTPARVTNMTLSGNVLHTSNGAGGYAAYQIPGVAPLNYSLTGNCSGPFTWTLSAGSAGSITSTGLYTAPASVTGTQTFTVSASNVTDPTQTAEATVTLSQVLALSLTAAAPSPYIVSNAAGFQAAVTSAGSPVPGVTVTLTVTGANARTLTAVSNASGIATFSYAGAARGVDSLQASAGGFSSGAISAAWLSPASTLTTSVVNGQFYTSASCASGCEAFGITSSQTPVFVQNFPDIAFGNTRPSPTRRSIPLRRRGGVQWPLRATGRRPARVRWLGFRRLCGGASLCPPRGVTPSTLAVRMGSFLVSRAVLRASAEF